MEKKVNGRCWPVVAGTPEVVTGECLPSGHQDRVSSDGHVLYWGNSESCCFRAQACFVRQFNELYPQPGGWQFATALYLNVKIEALFHPDIRNTFGSDVSTDVGSINAGAMP